MAFAPHSFAESINFLAILISPLWFNPPSAMTYVFFSVNVVARKPEKNTPETNPYVKKFLLKTSWKPRSLEVFAGKIDYPKYNFVDKHMIRFIMWMTKGPTNTNNTYEFTDWVMIDSFAKKVIT